MIIGPAQAEAQGLNVLNFDRNITYDDVLVPSPAKAELASVL